MRFVAGRQAGSPGRMGDSEERRALRLRAECESVFEATCAALEAAFVRRMEREQDAYEANWAARCAMVTEEFRIEVRRAREAVCGRLEAFDERPRAAAVPLPPSHFQAEDLELIHDTLGPTVRAQREAQLQLVEAREAAVEASRRRPDAVPVKVMGVLDPAILTAVGMSPEDISLLQERLRQPDFYPLKVVVRGEEAVEEFDRDHPELVALSLEFGPLAVDEVLRCFKELNDWNASSRSSIEIPWNDQTNAELKPADVIKRLARPRPTRTATRHRQGPPRPAPPAGLARVFLYNDQLQQQQSGGPPGVQRPAPAPSAPPSWAVRAPRTFAYLFGQQHHAEQG